MIRPASRRQMLALGIEIDTSQTPEVVKRLLPPRQSRGGLPTTLVQKSRVRAAGKRLVALTSLSPTF
jgi:hypothetical protein